MRSRRAGVVAIVVAVVALLVLVMAEFVSCGNGSERTAPTTFTTPRDTGTVSPTLPSTTGPTTPPTTVSAGPWQTGMNGTAGLDDAELNRELDAIAATGVKWVRKDFYWAFIQGNGPDSYDWRDTDRYVEGVISRGMQVLGLAAYTPAWARPHGTGDHHPPLNPDWYAQFMFQAAKRYAPLGVHAWEIWNEPNVDSFWQPRPDVARYAAMLERAYLAIKAADPEATVIVGGLSPGGDRSDGTTLSPRTFLTRLYDAGAGHAFDAVALHPYSFPALPLEAKDWNPFYNAPTLYQVMVDHGDARKKIWGTEFGAATSGPGSVSQDFQRQVVVAGYRAWAAWPFTGPLFVYQFRDSADDPGDREANFGLVNFDGRPKPALLGFESEVVALERRVERN